MIGTTIGNSLIWDNGTNVGIGNTNISYTLDVSGTGRYNGSATTMLSVVSTGTASGLELKNTGGTASDWIIQSDGGAVAGQAALRFYSLTASAYRMSIDGSGNVGIGTSSPSKLFTVVASADGQTAGISGATYGLRFDNGGSFAFGGSTIHGVDNTLTATYQILGLNGSQVIFGTSGTERMRITSGGNVGIGTSSPTNKLQIGTMTVPYSGNEFAIGNGTVDYAIDVSATSVDMYSSAAMSFATSTTERMRITSGGQIVMGRTTPSGSGRLTVDGDLYLHNITSGAGQSTLKYNYTSTGLVTYDTSSRLLKKDIENLGYGLDDVLKMSAKKYKWKRDDSIDLGFIADEMVQIIPEIVFFSTEMTNETTGVPIGEPLSINYDRLIPVLVNAIQELSAQNQDLKSRLDKAGL